MKLRTTLFVSVWVFGIVLGWFSNSLVTLGIEEYQDSHYALPPLPSYIPTPLANIPISYAPYLLDGKDSLWGAFDPKKWTVTIAAGASPLQNWLTFWHERYHIIVWETGTDLPADTEEDLAELYAHDQVWLLQHPVLHHTK